MKRFRKRPIVIEAKQWFSFGDHKEVSLYTPYNDGICDHCNMFLSAHGWISTLEGGHIVCSGDWIIKGIKNEFYPCKADIFEATYEEVNEI